MQSKFSIFNKNRLMSSNFLILTAAVLFISNANAQNAERLKLGGAFNSVFNVIRQENQQVDDARRQQFDLALNLDLQYSIRPNIHGYVQLQTGSGSGSLGLSGPELSVTDLNLEFDISPALQLTLGSFDTPFCLETQYLTNNGDGFSNALFLNSLFYSAFAGTNVGTLNTVGVKGTYVAPLAKFTVAVTNGTDESALNPDGNFGLVFSSCTQAIIPGLNLAASVIASDDTSAAGASGTRAKFRGWIFDSRYELSPEIFIHGFLGQFNYDDRLDLSKDKINVWKAEGRYGSSPWHLAARISGWMPAKSKGRTFFTSPFIPNPGFGIAQQENAPHPEQRIIRLQAAFGWHFTEDLLLKLEWFNDRYDGFELVRDFDVNGWILALNARF